jgi:hypothetical protein
MAGLAPVPSDEQRELAESEGFQWKPASDVAVGDLVRGRLRGGSIAWLAVLKVKRKPKRVWLILDARKAEGLSGKTTDLLPRYDEVIPVR